MVHLPIVAWEVEKKEIKDSSASAERKIIGSWEQDPQMCFQCPCIETGPGNGEQRALIGGRYCH